MQREIKIYLHPLEELQVFPPGNQPPAQDTGKTRDLDEIHRQPGYESKICFRFHFFKKRVIAVHILNQVITASIHIGLF
jgi:hypothetical protein